MITTTISIEGVGRSCQNQKENISNCLINYPPLERPIRPGQFPMCYRLPLIRLNWRFCTSSLLHKLLFFLNLSIWQPTCSTNDFSLSLSTRNSLCESADRQAASYAAGHLGPLAGHKGGRSNGSRLPTADRTPVQTLRSDQPDLRGLPHTKYLHTDLR